MLKLACIGASLALALDLNLAPPFCVLSAGTHQWQIKIMIKIKIKKVCRQRGARLRAQEQDSCV
jgi:hypothetical protein